MKERCVIMGQKPDKTRIIPTVVDCAKKYRDELENRMLLFICKDKNNQISCFEFTFYAKNFLHLTGLKNVKEKGISAKGFYRKCLTHKLSPDDFDIPPDGTSHMKLAVLPKILNKNLSARMIGECGDFRPQLCTDRFVGGVTACMGFKTDETSGLYVPSTVLKDDVRKNVRDYARVIAAYRKRITDENYEELTYKAKDVDLSGIKYPAEYSYLSPPVPALSV